MLVGSGSATLTEAERRDGALTQNGAGMACTFVLFAVCQSFITPEEVRQKAKDGQTLPGGVVEALRRTSLLNTERAGRKAYFRGREFEETVARWAKRRFRTDDVRIRERVSPRAEDLRPYEIDVHVHARVPGSLFSRGHIWLECKHLNRKIRREDVVDLVARNQRSRGGFFHSFPAFDYLGIVSTSDFDPDAIEVGNAEGVACIRYDHGRYELVNKVCWPWKVYWPWQ